MGLVIYNGVQYDSDRLPSGVDPKDCVPADKWFKENRNRADAAKPTKKAEPDGPKAIADMNGPELNELIDTLGLDVSKGGKVDERREKVAADVAALEELAALDDDARAAVAELAAGDGNG